jgi:hypothetical protein
MSSPGSQLAATAPVASVAIRFDRVRTLLANFRSVTAAPTRLTVSATSNSTKAFENTNGTWGFTASHALGLREPMKSAFEWISDRLLIDGHC